MTIEDLAHIAGVNRKTVIGIEQANRNVTIEYLYGVLTALDLRISIEGRVRSSGSGH
jgi:transcriptional regulator with XRE-family HTH domain